MKLTQKVDHFTVFNSFPGTNGCSQKLPPNNLCSPNVHIVDCALFQALRSLPVLDAAIQAFQITVNSPLLQLA